jgi:flagellar biosynthesis/type III secretory pathway protein FliH
LQQGVQQGLQQGLQQGVQQGLQQGLQQGVQQGLQQGVQQGEATLLRRLLQKRFGQLPNWVEERLVQAKSEQLEQWSLRLLEVNTLEEIWH